MQLSARVTLKAVPHLSQWLRRFRRETLYPAHKKSQNSVANNNVPDTVVPRMLIQAPLFLACRIRRLSVPLRSQTKSLIFVSLALSRSFCPSRLSYLSIRRWPVLENAPPPVMAQISYALPF